jgi:hypothetical protein
VGEKENGVRIISSTIVSAVLGEMGREGVMGDRMVGKELMGVSTRVLMAMSDMFQDP